MRSEPPRLSLLVNTCDEAHVLEDCLRSTAGLADEIVVVDMGSADGSRDVAARFGAHVHEHERTPVVELARDFGLARCRGEWVLVLDPDERLAPDLAAWIREFLAAPPASVRAVAFPRRNWLFGAWLRGGSWWPGYQVRLFRRGEGSYGRSIHVQPVSGAGVIRVEARPELALEHLAYRSIDEFVERTLRRYTEAETRLGRHRPVGPVRLTALVVRRFLVELVWKRGYRDGMRGFVAAGLLSTYEFPNRAKAWERDGAAPALPEAK